MALTVSAAQIIKSGGPYMHVLFSVIQDGAATTVSGLALPAGFPNLQAQLPATTGLPTSYTGQGPVVTATFMNVLGGTAAAGTTVTALKQNASNPATQLDITISAAGSAGNTVNVMAIVPGTF